MKHQEPMDSVLSTPNKRIIYMIAVRIFMFFTIGTNERVIQAFKHNNLAVSFNLSA